MSLSCLFFFFSSRRRHTRLQGDWSSDVCSSDLVGSNDDIKKLAGANTTVINAKGRLVLPGFNDAHVHFMSGGFQLSSVDLRDANTRSEERRVGKECRYGWSQDN